MDDQKYKTAINILYIFLIISTVLSFVPTEAAQILSLVIVTVTLIVAYILRLRDSEDGLVYNHMTYLIGTIWIGTGFLLLGMIAAGTWVFLHGDHAVLDSAISQVQAGAIPDQEMINQVISDYMIANKSLLILSSIPTIGPAVLYFVYRVANGYGRAMKGYRIAKPKSWL